MAKGPELKVVPDHEEPEITVAATPTGEMRPIEDARPLSGERFGKYLLIGELAKGGMAEIFLAVHKGLEDFLKVVVVKRVLPNLSANADFVQMFIDEARLAARLEHRNLIRTYEFGEHDGQYFTVMEYLPGEDIGKILIRLAMSAAKAPYPIIAHVIAQAAAGLHFAHELTDTAGRPLGLVHRDINPANLVVTYAGEVKVIDFGVAKSATNTSQTLAGTIKGKIAYMAPEQVLARGIDRRSDVFSLGVVLWELITGQPLFARDTEAATLYAIMNDPIPSVRKFRPDVPAKLEDIVARALSRTPADRYDTAEELQLDLETFLASQPKMDSRALGSFIEDLFGTTRAEAKRAIAQTRALPTNVSLVMKLRSDVRSDLASTIDALDPAGRSRTGVAAPAPRRATATLAIGLAALALVGGGIGYVALRGNHEPAPAAATATRGSLQLDSTPAGAAIFVGGEPTGLVTPATLTDLSAGSAAIRLELAGHAAASDTVTITGGETAQKRYTLAALQGRLVLAGLPAGATIVVDGQTYTAGEVISLAAGSHAVRIVAEGATVAEQSVDTREGDQVYQLADGHLSRRTP